MEANFEQLKFACSWLLSLCYFYCVLCYKSEGRWFDSSWCHWNFLLTSNPSDRTIAHSACDRNEYQEYFLGIKAAGA